MLERTPEIVLPSVVDWWREAGGRENLDSKGRKIFLTVSGLLCNLKHVTNLL
jgi:hypothetical protein